MPNYCIKEKKYEGNLNYSGNNLNLLFVGSLQIIQNIESLKYFSKIFFPLIKEKYPNICVDIVGRYKTIFIKHLCKLNDGVSLFNGCIT